MLEHVGAVEWLSCHQRQLDEDGVEVGVSRQALDEVLARLAALEAVKEAAQEIVYKDVNTWRVGVHGDSPVPKLGAAIEALSALPETGGNGT